MSDRDARQDEGLLSRDDPGLNAFDRVMLERADESSENPWLEVSVMSHIESREMARVWLNDNGSLFGNGRGRVSVYRGAVGAIHQSIQELLSAARNTRLWATIGAAAGGGVIAYFMAAILDTPDPTSMVSTTVVSAIAGVLAAGMAVQLPYLREFYS